MKSSKTVESFVLIKANEEVRDPSYQNKTLKTAKIREMHTQAGNFIFEIKDCLEIRYNLFFLQVFKTLVKKDVLCYSLTAKPGDSKYFQATHYIRRQKNQEGVQADYKTLNFIYLGLEIASIAPYFQAERTHPPTHTCC